MSKAVDKIKEIVFGFEMGAVLVAVGGILAISYGIPLLAGLFWGGGAVGFLPKFKEKYLG